VFASQESRRWYRENEQRLLDLVVTAAPQLTGPSLLPGWGRADVVAHLIGNAWGLSRLVDWAATGVVNPMYPDRAARAAQIADLATRPAGQLRTDLAAASAQLQDSFFALTPAQLAHPIRNGRDDDCVGADIAWMRAREAAVHLVDLDIGAGFADLPEDFLDTMRDEVLGWLGRDDVRDRVPAVEIHVGDRDQIVRLGPPRPNPAIIEADSAQLVAWLQGRPAPAGTSRAGWPQLPPWL
jgi:maleylpyruvate isomerase